MPSESIDELIRGLNEDPRGEFSGTPAADPAPVPVVAEPKAMLQAALRAEEETLQRYLERRRQAEAAGEFGLAVQVDDIIADETHHRDALRQMLARWP